MKQLRRTAIIFIVIYLSVTAVTICKARRNPMSSLLSNFLSSSDPNRALQLLRYASGQNPARPKPFYNENMVPNRPNFPLNPGVARPMTPVYPNTNTVPFTDMRQLNPVRQVLGQQKFVEMPYANVVQARVDGYPTVPGATSAAPCATPCSVVPEKLSCPGSSPMPLVNPFLPAASPVSAMAPPTSNLLPPVIPGQSKSHFLRKIPIPPPSL